MQIVHTEKMLLLCPCFDISIYNVYFSFSHFSICCIKEGYALSFVKLSRLKALHVCVSIQLQSQGRQHGSNSKVRATVAPLPSAAATSSSSSLGPPPAKTSRPALSFLSSSHRARAPIRQEEDNNDDNSMIIQ